MSRTVTSSTHAHRVDTLEGLSALCTHNPIVVDVLRVDAIVPRSGAEDVPLDGRAAHHRLLVACTHDDSPPVRKGLILSVVNIKRASA